MKSQNNISYPTDIEEILSEIRQNAIRIFASNLVGVYLHGSLAFGCFCREKSDIDFIVVTHSEPDLNQKADFIRALLKIDEKSPQKGLEMSLVLEEHCRRFVYPTPYQLHFSNSHKEKCRSDLHNFCLNMKGTDKDLAAHFTVIRQVGIPLWGKSVESLFGEVPREAYLDSLRYDVEHAVEDIIENPLYVTLNLCRVLAYLREGRILSKKDGALWGLSRLPGEFHPLIREAERAYRTAAIMEAKGKEAQLRKFAATALREILPGAAENQ